MIYVLLVLWILSSVYFINHIRLINQELIALDKEQHQQNMDIISILKQNIEISNAIDNHAKVITEIVNVTEYSLNEKESKKLFKTGSDIFNTPKGEA